MKSKLGKLLAILTAFILLFSSMSGKIIAKEYQINAGEKIKYPSWFDDSGSWSTRKYTVDGKIAYCLEASKHSPSDGSVVEGNYLNNENLQKVLYYGYGGPGDTLSTDGITSDNMAYLLTHIAASYYYAGDLHGVDMEKLRGWGWAEWIESIPSRPAIPKGEVSFSKGNLKMYPDGNNQRSEELTLNGDANSTLTLTLPEQVTLHNLTTKKNVTNKVTLTSGDRFYLSAPLTSRTNYHWSSGLIKGTTTNYYQPLVLTINSSTQTIGTMVLGKGEANPTKLEIDFIPVGSLQLIKMNEDEQLLDGAVFNLKGVDNDYNQDHVVKGGLLTIDNLLVGNYLLSEIKTPDGHDSIIKEYPIVIKENVVTKQTIINELRPVGKLIINKQLENKDDDLSGIEFKLTAKEDIKDIITKQVLYHQGEQIGLYQTDKIGKVVIDHLPMGSYLVTETKTLDGYVLDKNIYQVNFTKQDNVTKEYQYTLDLENKLTKTSILKIDAQTKKEVAGATLELYLKENQNCVLVDRWVSDGQPHLINGLLVDHEYILKEVKAPDGYQLAKEITFKIDNDTKVKEIVLENELQPTIPLTGDDLNYQSYIGLLLISFIAFFIIVGLKKSYNK